MKKLSGSTTTVYVFSGSKVIAEYDNGAAPTAPSREYVYGGGALLAKIDSSGTKYYHQDHLSNRLVTDPTGNTYSQMGHFPFGDPWYNATNDKLYFTTYERDAESSNDYAMARYYVWRIGRFTSLDPLSGSTSDPQSLDRYTYVENNPANAIDPTGQMRCEQMCPNWNGSGGGGGGDDGDLFDYQIVENDSYGYAPSIDYVQYSWSSVQSKGPDGSISYELVTTVTDTIYGPVYQGGIDLIGSVGPSDPGNDPIKPWQMRKPVVDILRAKNDCSAWFNQGTGSAADLMSNVPILLYTPDPQWVSMNMPDAGTGSPGSPIRVNSLGRFYTDRYNPSEVGDVFPAGGTGAQIAVLLHELAHQILPPGFISDDGSTPGASKKNTLLLLQHCLSAIDAKSIEIRQKGLP